MKEEEKQGSNLFRAVILTVQPVYSGNRNGEKGDDQDNQKIPDHPQSYGIYHSDLSKLYAPARLDGLSE